jgi:D-alanyl-D-alanine dipeptidase
MRIVRGALTLLPALIAGDGAAAQTLPASGLPAPLVHLRSVDATILQEMRYAGADNFMGRALPGYAAGECVLLASVAAALARVQRELAPLGYALKVYDCYRPRRAALVMAAWVHEGNEQQRAPASNPRIDRSQLRSLGYIAATSGHSRGDSVDVTLVRRTSVETAAPPMAPARPCHLAPAEAGPHPSVDMGTAYDCFDVRSHIRAGGLTPEQREARRILHEAMGAQGFRGYSREWWHFSMTTREGGGRSFDVPVPPLHP